MPARPEPARPSAGVCARKRMHLFARPPIAEAVIARRDTGIRAARGAAIGVAVLMALTGCVLTRGLHLVSMPNSGVPCRMYPSSPGPPGCGWVTGPMTAVKAISPTDAWAVGADSFNESRGAQLRAVIEHWDGKRWRVAARPLGPSPFSSLTSVDAAGRSDVWAVGWDPQRPLALHFNGTAWARATLPTASGFDAYLADVSVASAADVWAVGTETST